MSREQKIKDLAERIREEVRNMKNSIPGTPVKYSNTYSTISSEVSEQLECVDDPICENDIMQEAPLNCTQPSKEEKEELLSQVKFSDQIKIDFIPSIDYRILCRFLGVTSVNDIKNHPYQSHPLITLILMESLIGFMKKEGYDMAGELNFDANGNSIPPEKNPWTVKGKETTFTTTGFLYFEKIEGKRKDNVAFFLFTNLDRGGASIMCYSTDTNKSKDIVNELQVYSKNFNCLRGAKLKDVNMISASFSEVEVSKDYTWDNYYFSKEIRDLFQLEVFDFVKNVKKYNECGITKRGLIMHSRPGCGKTTIGNIICNMVPNNTVIWITPEILSENNYKAMSSIKALYKLADFLSPCIILLEDLDLFSQDREMGGGLEKRKAIHLPFAQAIPRSYVIDETVCTKCGKPVVNAGVCSDCYSHSRSPAVDGVRAPFSFDGVVRSAIYQFKYRNLRALAQPLAELLFSYLQENTIEADVLVPVPLNRHKVRERGYNQAALLARELGKMTGWPVIHNSLVRFRDGPPQARTATAEERRRNVTGAFSCQDERLVDKHILLIDDVCTTGATINSCASVLKRLPAASVWALTVAREL